MKDLITKVDAFSHGQVESKIWLCEEFERVCWLPNPNIFVLGGWHGMIAFLLLSRGNLKIKTIKSFDVDPTCEPVADAINNAWLVDNWRFKAYTRDCNDLDYSEMPDVVINTSTEHFDSLKWFENIPKGRLVCLQGNNLNHEDHFSSFESYQAFKDHFKFSNVLYEGQKDFVYPDFSFTRYMIIGIK